MLSQNNAEKIVSNKIVSKEFLTRVGNAKEEKEADTWPSK